MWKLTNYPRHTSPGLVCMGASQSKKNVASAGDMKDIFLNQQRFFIRPLHILLLVPANHTGTHLHNLTPGASNHVKPLATYILNFSIQVQLKPDVRYHVRIGRAAPPEEERLLVW